MMLHHWRPASGGLAASLRTVTLAVVAITTLLLSACVHRTPPPESPTSSSSAGSAFPSASPSSPVYKFTWQATATVAEIENGKTVTRRGEIQGDGALLLSKAEGGMLFEFDGRGGSGRGSIALGSVEWMGFPTPPEITIPPAPPHPAGGLYTFKGNPDAPTSFEIRFAEAFICRTDPKACDNVVTWERVFKGVATLARVGI